MHSIENATQLQTRGEDSRPAAWPELRLVSDPLSQRRWLYAASTSESTSESAPDNTGGFSGTVSSTQLKSGFSRRGGGRRNREGLEPFVRPHRRAIDLPAFFFYMPPPEAHEPVRVDRDLEFPATQQ